MFVFIIIRHYVDNGCSYATLIYVCRVCKKYVIEL
jgi:hypothetical protein